jgi:hypothetical protein
LWEPENVNYNTTALRRQLGATKIDMNKERRGIFTITKTSVLVALASIYGQPVVQNQYRGPWNWVADAYPSLTASGDFAPPVSGSTSALMWAIIDDIITETNSPAKAMQAFNDVPMRSYYYRNMNQLLATTSVRITQFKMALVPSSFRGYLTVIGIVFVHLLLFFIVTTLFARTRSSLLGNSWLALAQLANSPDVRNIFEHAAMATDKDVEKWIRSDRTHTSVIPRATAYQNIKAWTRRLIRPQTWNIKRIFRRAFWRRREGKAPVRRYVVKDGIFVPAQDQGDKVSV